MEPRLKWRRKAKLALENYFRERSFPRTMLSTLLAITGLIGFLFSWALLRAGVEQMWMRYPLAVLGSYAFFLALIRGWVELEHRRFDPKGVTVEMDDSPEERPKAAPAPRRKLSGVSWLDGLDFDIPTEAEGCAVVFLVGAVAGLVMLLVAAVLDAPGLLAEVFLDAFLVTALYRRLRIAAREHWLGTALRQTWWTVLVAALLLALAGWCLQALAPDEHTMLPALEHLFD